ncbi:tripartite ATP-independent transporter solute receptor, DctP family [Bosea sp. OK403]|uniref:TRAP transporter substrate-binding protein n=1 Tax=Bosea sp. OK403 TaxID=1855286 RepID=UPI0008F3514E|nr:TRAP transporter substrate-binding protein [Bosea sp. OK403]SFJ77517.1 tripartite ATP-independent transporter solute receptor, DctP family [Bosea sp. OK403]
MAKTLHRRALLQGAGSAAAFAIAGGPALAAPKYVARMSIEVQEGHPKFVAVDRFAKLVAERTKGEVEIKVFPNSQLGGELETAEGIRLGSIQIGLVTSSVLVNWVPDVQALDLPFIFQNDAHAIKASGPLTEQLKPRFEAQGFHLLGFSVNGARELISTFPIEKPEDVRGKKMRVIQSPLHLELWKAFGANPVPIPAPEIYTSLQTRVVDFCDNTTTNYKTFRFYEVAPHFTKLDHIYALGSWIVGIRWWRSLPKEHQAVIEQAAREIQPVIPELLAKTDEEALAFAKAEGHAKIVLIADKQPWRAATAKVYEQFVEKIPNGQELAKLIGSLQ